MFFKTINRIGIIIIATVTSFVIMPPLLSLDESSIVQWKNVFIFFAGIASIFFYDRTKNKTTPRVFAFILSIVLIILILIYEFFYNVYSLTCFNKYRIIISNSKVKDSLIINYDYWVNHPNGLSAKLNLLQANGCSSINVWNISDLYFPYFSMIILYILIITDVVMIMALFSDLAEQKYFTKSTNTR